MNDKNKTLCSEGEDDPVVKIHSSRTEGLSSVLTYHTQAGSAGRGSVISTLLLLEEKQRQNRQEAGKPRREDPSSKVK